VVARCFIKGIINKIKVLNRAACGYRNFNNFKIEVYNILICEQA